MSPRSLIVRSAVLASLALTAAVPSLVLAADAAPAATATDASQPTFAGVINANSVYVRSGPGDNYYATVKLDKGEQIKVVGIKFDWLKIVPPDGSFSYVAKAYVEKRGDGSVGRVTKPDLNVRAGSDLNAMKTTVQTKLDANVDVAILGEQDEYFKIKPPQDAFLYINKQFVDPVKPTETIASVPAATGTDPIVSAPIKPMVSSTPAVAAKTDAPAKTDVPSIAKADDTKTTVVAAASTTQPAVAVAPTTQASPEVAIAPSTQPAETPTAEAQFDTLETAFLDATNLPLDQQPIDDLLTKYTTLTKEETLPVSMRRIAELRVSTLTLRADARNQYASALKMQAEAKAKQQALKAEAEELQARAKSEQLTIYSALGTLRTSALQQNGQTLYRLTDPGTGRTVVYVRSTDPKFAGMLNQFVGVRGEISDDPNMNLKIITPKESEVVDQSKVNTNITATILPPTLLPKAPAVSMTSN